MIRKAEKSDSVRLLEIWESAVLATHDFLKKEDFLFYKSSLPQYLENTESIYKYIDENGHIKAFLGVSDTNIDMLFVHADYRGHGIGKKMILYAVEVLGAKRVDVNEQNTQAYEFYTYMGFDIESRDEKDGMGKDYPILHLTI